MKGYNLELLLDAVNIIPEYRDIGNTPEINIDIFERYENYNDDAKLTLMERFGFDEPPKEKEKAHFFDRIERLPRLDDGTYKVFVPGSKVEAIGLTIDVPEISVDIEHKRTYHNVAKFDPKIFDSKEPYKILFEEKNNNIIKELVNVELIGEYFSSVFSNIHYSLDLPDNWEEANSKFEDFFKNEMKEHRIETNIVSGKLYGKGKTAKRIKKVINRRNKEFVEKNKKLFDDFAKPVMILRTQAIDAFNKFIDSYSELMFGTPFVSKYKPTTHLGLDNKGRVLFDSPIHEDSVLQKLSLNSAIISEVEKLPFNDKFHDDFRKELLITEKDPEYMIRSKSFMRNAIHLSRRGDYANALTDAATAFEVTLDGFLLDGCAATKEQIMGNEKIPGRNRYYNISDKMNGLFNKAVRNSLGVNDRKDYFSKSMKEKILNMGKNEEERRNFQHKRNMKMHRGIRPGENSNEAAVSLIGISVYNEAIRYITKKGWEKDIPLNSEIYTWMSPDIKNEVPDISETIMDDIRKGYDHVMKYLTPDEVGRHNKNILPGSWVKR